MTAQWYQKEGETWVAVENGTANGTISTPNLELYHALPTWIVKKVKVTVTDGVTTITSREANLTVNPPTLEFYLEPDDVYVDIGEDATFYFNAVSSYNLADLHAEWFEGPYPTEIEGNGQGSISTPDYIVPSVTLENDGSIYSVKVTDNFGNEIISRTATLYVNCDHNLRITSQPQEIYVYPGGTAQFYGTAVSDVSDATLNTVWYKNSFIQDGSQETFQGVANPYYEMTNCQPVDSGSTFSFDVWDECTVISSSGGTLYCYDCTPGVIASQVTNGSNPTWDLTPYQGKRKVQASRGTWRLRETGANLTYNSGSISIEGEMVGLPSSFRSNFQYNGYMVLEVIC